MAGRGVEITAVKADTKAVYRILGKEVYLKINNPAYAVQLVAGLRDKGAIVEEKRGWYKIDMFREYTEVTLGAVTMDLTKMTNAEITDLLKQFFLGVLQTSEFECTIKEI